LRQPPREPDTNRASPSLLHSYTACTSRDDLRLRAAEPFGFGRSAAPGGDMLFMIALVLLAAWLLGIVGIYNVGTLVHVLLLVGLMLLLLAFLRAREAAVRRVVGDPPEKQ
jgi:hypothetical protein